MPHKRTPRGSPLRWIGYLRVSTEDQSLSPSAQRAALERFAAASGVELLAVFEDLGFSGADRLEDRPGLLAALDALAEEGAGALVVAKRDRLARDPLVAAMIEASAARAGAVVLSAAGEGNGEDPTAVLMRRIVDAFAEYERLLIRSRTRAALAVKRSRGELTGTPPLGTTVAEDGIHLAPALEEAAAVARVHALRAEGLSVRGIAERLDAEGAARRGKRWHPTTVARLLARPAPPAR